MNYEGFSSESFRFDLRSLPLHEFFRKVSGVLEMLEYATTLFFLGPILLT